MNLMQWQVKCIHHRFSRGACSAQTHAAHTDLNKRPQLLLLQQSLLLTRLSAFTHTHLLQSDVGAMTSSIRELLVCLAQQDERALSIQGKTQQIADKLLRCESDTLIHNLSYVLVLHISK
jgi:hypothetical protein